MRNRKQENKKQGNRRENSSDMNNALKFLLLAVGCIIVVGLITLGMRITEKGKKDTDRNLGQYSEAASKTEDIDLLVYDDTEVLGSEIKRLIRDKAGDEYLSIKVINGKGKEEDYINKSSITNNVVEFKSAGGAQVSKKPSDDTYINDAGIFHAELFYDTNGVAACIRFTQRVNGSSAN